MVKLSILGVLLLITPQVFALKYTIYTDEPDGKKAQEVIKEMKSTYPFTAFNVEFEVLKVPASQLDCSSKMGIDRLVSCETDQLVKDAARRGSDQVMIVKDLNKWGGSAAEGGVPVITTKTSARAMIHEYMHVLGLCDEYEYKPQEADIYCKENGRERPNLTIISPLPQGYESDDHARKVHNKDIPWYKRIKPGTPITSGSKLGTGATNYDKDAPRNDTTSPTILDDAIGLYKGKSCKNASRKIHSWHPGGNANIMENLNNGLGAPLESIVADILASKGAKRNEGTFDSVVNTEPEIEISDPPLEVNNSPRNFFKSFFEAIGNFFKSIFDVISK